MTHDGSGFGKTGQREYYTENIPLNQRRPSSKLLLDDAEEDIHPDSDASLLRKHFDDDNDGEDKNPSEKSPPDFLNSLPAFMSRTPLLSRSQKSRGIGPYVSRSSGSLTGEVDELEPQSCGTDHVRSKDRRKGKTPTWGAADSPDPESSEASGIGAPSQHRQRSFENSDPLLGDESASKATNPREEAVDVDETASRWSDENPFDNSPLVTPLLIGHATFYAFSSRLICQRRGLQSISKA